MKRLPGILIALSLLTALLVGCGSGHDARVTAELDRADSLLRTSDTAAHSTALRQMLALDTARALQADEALRARHALLLTQAQFKCYAFPSNDSLINIARNYYAKHHTSAQDHELYTRSLIYSGAVAQMTDNPQQAMQWYLEAESAADPNDHFNLGYINLRIAEIYQSEYITDSTDLVRYKQALPHFVKAGSDYYQAICLTGIGGLYRTHNNDSAMHYLQQAISFSKEHGLTYNYYEALDKLCGLYYVTNEYEKAKDVAMQIYRENQGTYDGTQYISFGIISFAKLGMTDSAKHYLKLLPAPQTQVDSIMYHKDLLAIAESKNDDKSVISHYLMTDEITDSIIVQSKAELLKTTEQEYKTNLLKRETEKAKGKLWFLWTVIALIVLPTCYVTYKFFKAKALMSRLNRENRSISQTLANLQEKANKLEQKAKENQADAISADRAIDSEMAILTELKEKLSFPRKLSFKDVLFSQGLPTKLTLKPLSPDFWNNLLQVANIKTKGLISYLNNNYDCKPKDLRFISLVSLGFSNQMIQQCMDYSNIKTVSNYKSNIIKNITGENKTLDLFIEDYRKNKHNFKHY